MKQLRITILLSLLLTILVGCSDTVQKKELEKEVNVIIEEDKKQEIEIGSLTDFDWEKAYLFPPYTGQNDIDKLITNFKDSSNIDTRDDIYLLVFVEGNEATHYIEMNRNGKDFTVADEGNYLTPDNDKILIVNQ